MSDATKIPILLDGDTGYGNFNNARRLVKKLEQRKIAGVCIEDKLFPKTNSFISGETQPLADIDEFCGKIKSMKDSQEDDDFVVVSRVEAFIAGWGLREALRRAEAYRRAGADGIFIHSKRTDIIEIEAFMKEWGDKLPVLIAPTKYYSVPTDKFRDLGVSVAIWANHNLRCAVSAMQKTTKQIFKDEGLVNVENEVVTVEEIFRLQGARELEEAEKKYLPTADKKVNAIILAASQGNLNELTGEIPKTLLKVNGKSLLSMQIDKFNRVGIREICVVRGFAKEKIEMTNIETVDNDQYAKTKELYSLYLTSTLYKIKDCISDDFILLESDLIYDKTGLVELLQHEESDVILASGLTGSNDEVFIEIRENGCLVNMSKNMDELSRVDAELTGISKISYATFKLMCDFVENDLKHTIKLDYENVLVGICHKTDIYTFKLEDFAWCEIDDKRHWQRAVSEVYHKIKVREKGFHPVQRTILLNPGPATTTDSVKYAQVVPDICPREKEFGEIIKFISTELTCFAANSEDYTTVLFGGSGTAAVESILSSVVGEDVILIVNNGAYGKRMCQIADVYKLNYIEFQSPHDQALDLSRLENTIQKSHRKLSYLAIVHNETTTGLLNDIESVGKVCKKYKIKMIVDAMSSFGAVPIDMNKMNISYLAASSNKNLQGIAGVSFVISRKASLESTKNIRPRNYYLHLYSQYKYFSETLQMRFTPPVQTLYSLKQAIIETKLEGIVNRYERYKQSWKVLIDGITGLGLKHLVNEKNHSKIITAIIEPDCSNYNFDKMHDYFYSKGFTLYPGKIDQFNTFRVANIGDISSKDIESFLVLLEQYFKDIGFIK